MRTEDNGSGTSMIQTAPPRSAHHAEGALITQKGKTDATPQPAPATEFRFSDHEYAAVHIELDLWAGKSCLEAPYQFFSFSYRSRQQALLKVKSWLHRYISSKQANVLFSTDRLSFVFRVCLIHSPRFVFVRRCRVAVGCPSLRPNECSWIVRFTKNRINSLQCALWSVYGSLLSHSQMKYCLVVNFYRGFTEPLSKLYKRSWRAVTEALEFYKENFMAYRCFTEKPLLAYRRGRKFYGVSLLLRVLNSVISRICENVHPAYLHRLRRFAAALVDTSLPLLHTLASGLFHRTAV